MAAYKGCTSVVAKHPGDICLVSAVLIINSSAPSGLEKLIEFVIADLHVAASGLGNVSSIRLMEHIHTVLSVLHTEAESELGVTPYIIINGSRGFLCGKDKVDT